MELKKREGARYLFLLPVAEHGIGDRELGRVHALLSKTRGAAFFVSSGKWAGLRRGRLAVRRDRRPDRPREFCREALSRALPYCDRRAEWRGGPGVRVDIAPATTRLHHLLGWGSSAVDSLTLQPATDPRNPRVSWFSRKPHPEERHPEPRDALFGDVPLALWMGDGTSEPWIRFADASTCLARHDTSGAEGALASVVAMSGLESRHYLQAWHALLAIDHPPPAELAKRLHGVVIETTLAHGTDILAVYDDHTARYFNARRSGAIWEHPNTSLDPLIDELLRAGREIVLRIGAWKEERRGPPPRGHTRISLLTPSGLHFGEGPLETLSRDALAGPAIAAGVALVRALTELVAAR